MADKPVDQVVGLQTLTLRGQVMAVGSRPPVLVDTAVRAYKKRVFTDEQWAYLNTRSTVDLQHRIRQGFLLIWLLRRPEMMNMVKGEADRVSSNLCYQIEAICQIIKSRGGQDEHQRFIS
jgi:hypothetical protein